MDDWLILNMSAVFIQLMEGEKKTNLLTNLEQRLYHFLSNDVSVHQNLLAYYLYRHRRRRLLVATHSSLLFVPLFLGPCLWDQVIWSWGERKKNLDFQQQKRDVDSDLARFDGMHQ